MEIERLGMKVNCLSKRLSYAKDWVACEAGSEVERGPVDSC
jgi:hypothetical protein